MAMGMAMAMAMAAGRRSSSIGRCVGSIGFGMPVKSFSFFLH